MSIPDDLMREWFVLLPDRPASEIDALIDPAKTHPMAAKKTIARDIVGFYYGADAAMLAQGNWEKQFSDKQDPDNIPETTIPAADATNGMGLLRLLVAVGFCKSNNKAR